MVLIGFLPPGGRGLAPVTGSLAELAGAAARTGAALEGGASVALDSLGVGVGGATSVGGAT